MDPNLSLSLGGCFRTRIQGIWAGPTKGVRGEEGRGGEGQREGYKRKFHKFFQIQGGSVTSQQMDKSCMKLMLERLESGLKSASDSMARNRTLGEIRQIHKKYQLSGIRGDQCTK